MAVNGNITPVVLHKYNENIPDTCLGCSCYITVYGSVKLLGMIEKILDVNIPLSPLIFLFHLYPKEIKLKKTYIYKYTVCICQAKRLISLNWKSIYAPNIGRWLKEMVTNMLMEKITYILRDKYIIFDGVWGPFKLFLKCGGVGNVLIED